MPSTLFAHNAKAATVLSSSWSQVESPISISLLACINRLFVNPQTKSS